MSGTGLLDDEALAWVHDLVAPTGPAEQVRVRPWSTVARFPVADGHVWFKACAPVQAFEPHLAVALASRWPALLPEILGYDEARAWTLTRDAGTVLRQLGNPPELWLRVLPAYAELQRGECEWAADHLAHGVADLRTRALPARYPDLLSHDLPLDGTEDQLRRFEPTYARWCAQLADAGIPDSIQHDDLHDNNVYVDGDRLRILDWGDSSVSHPFASLVVTFRFLERMNGLHPSDPWFARLRDAYLEPWGSGLVETFDLAMRVGRFAHAIAWVKQREAMAPADRPAFDAEYRLVLRRAADVTVPE